MQIHNNQKKYITIIAISLIALFIGYFVVSKVNNENHSLSESIYSTSTYGVIKYQDNTIRQNNNSITTEEDIVQIRTMEDMMLVQTVPNKEYPQGQYTVYQNQKVVLELPAHTNDAIWVENEVIYAVTEKDGTDIYLQSGQKITSVPYQYARILPAGRNFIILYITDSEEVGHIYYDRKNNSLKNIFISDDFSIACVSDDLAYFILSPINDPTGPYQLYTTQNKTMTPLESSLMSDTLVWLKGKGFISLAGGFDFFSSNKLVLIQTDAQQKILYESNETLSDFTIKNNQALMVTTNGKQFEAGI